MDLLDVVLLVVILLTALRGLRLGAAVQVLSFGGRFGGLAIGVVLVLLICPHVTASTPRRSSPSCSCSCRRPCSRRQAATWEQGCGDGFGGRASASSTPQSAAIVAVGGALVVVWVLASILVNSQFSLVANQIDGSRIIRVVTNVMPPIPTAMAPVERFLSDEGLQLVADGFIQLAGPVPYPPEPRSRPRRESDGPSTVKVVAVGCGEIQEGSGFVVGHGLVVTNAHVSPARRPITVDDAGRRPPRAEVVLFDPEFDLAVLRVTGLVRPVPLRSTRDLVGRGTEGSRARLSRRRAARSGDPAGVRSEILATGLDIYGQQPDGARGVRGAGAGPARELRRSARRSRTVS